jgi:hypothetical protein
MNIRSVVLVAGGLAALLWLLSGVFWALSANVEIGDNIDAFIGDLQRAGYWNAWAARAACAAAVFSAVVAICEFWRTE